MANTILTPGEIVREILMILRNNLGFTRHVTRKYDNRFANSGGKKGDTIDLRLPSRFIVKDGAVMVLQDYVEQSVPLKLEHQFHTAISFTTKDLTLTMDDFKRQASLESQISEISNEIDRVGMLETYREVSNFVGTPGVTPSTSNVYLNGGALMSEEAVPTRPRYAVITPRMEATIIPGLQGLQHSGPQITRQYEDGSMGRAMGFDWEMDQNAPTHTIGALGGTPQVSGANQTGSSILTSGWTNAAAIRLNRGDIIQFAGVYAVNPKSRQSTGQLRGFVVTADSASDASGVMTIPISPPLVPPDSMGNPVQYQTVSASPANGAAVTTFGAVSTYQNVVSPQGMLFHPEAFVFASVDLEMPPNVWGDRVADDDLGISVRILKQYSINDDQVPCRVDVLCGWKAPRPLLAARVVG